MDTHTGGTPAIRTSDTIEHIADALASVVWTDVTKGSTAQMGSYSYTYTNLHEAVEHVREPLRQAGVIVLQASTVDGVTTRLLHRSGQWIETGPTPLVAPKQAGPQEVGGAITYSRRYSLLAALSLAGHDDDDAAAAQKRHQDIAAEEAAHAEQVNTVFDALRHLSTEARDEIKLRADGRKLTKSELAADAAWLSTVDEWTLELGGTE